MNVQRQRWLVSPFYVGCDGSGHYEISMVSTTFLLSGAFKEFDHPVYTPAYIYNNTMGLKINLLCARQGIKTWHLTKNEIKTTHSMHKLTNMDAHMNYNNSRYRKLMYEN